MRMPVIRGNHHWPSALLYSIHKAVSLVVSTILVIRWSSNVDENRVG